VEREFPRTIIIYSRSETKAIEVQKQPYEDR
jgi:hypothetical protein